MIRIHPSPSIAPSSSAPCPCPSPSPSPSASSAQPHPAPAHAAHPPPPRPSKDRRSSLPFTFPPLFFGPGNASSTSLVPSTAEGRPIPLDDSTAAHRTSALREINSNYPSPVSHHRYAKSTGAKSSTYSQPVIVRTYSGPSPAHAHSHSHSHAGRPYRPPSASRAGSRRIPLSASSTSAPFFGSVSASKPIGVGVSSIGRHANGGLLSMARAKAKKKLPWQWVSGGGSREQDEDKLLPPLEAFSFKSFMADMQEGDIGADLDRIAEICARSRYSLSNQYEVHVTPHGSGSGFAAGAPSSSSRRKGHGHRREAGPTLQAIQSDDDESNPRTHRKRRSAGRRKSVAYGTLETIMSSSRSSEEDKTKKKSAADIAEEVRGRASKKGAGKTGSRPGTGSSSGSGAREAEGEDASAKPHEAAEEVHTARSRKSTSFAHAVIDSTRHAAAGSKDASPRSSAAALVSEPALPQTSSSHLEIRTAPDAPYHESSAEFGADSPFSQDLLHTADHQDANAGLLSGFSSWVPWRIGAAAPLPNLRAVATSTHAAGSLRELLKTTDGKQSKGKGVDREL